MNQDLNGRRNNIDTQTEDKKILFPCCDAVSSQVGRLASRFGCYHLLNELRAWLWPVKDNLGLHTPGIYKIPFSWGKMYIVQLIIKEHNRCIRLNQLEKSGLVEHCRLHQHHPFI